MKARSRIAITGLSRVGAARRLSLHVLLVSALLSVQSAATFRAVAPSAFSGSTAQAASPVEVPSTIAQVAVGSTPTGVAVDEARGLVYVSNSADDTVSVIDAARAEQIARAPVGKTPGAIVVEPVSGKVYVANLESDSISVLESGGRSAIATIAVGSLPRVSTLAVDRNPRRVFVVDTGKREGEYLPGLRVGTVRAIDPTTDEVVDVWPKGNEWRRLSVAVTMIGGLTVDGLSHRVYFIVSNRSGTEVDALGGAPLEHLDVKFSDRSAYTIFTMALVADDTCHTLVTLSVWGDLAIWEPPVALPAGEARVRKVVVLDNHRSVRYAGYDGASLAVDRRARVVYATRSWEGRVYAYDADTLAVIGRSEIGGTPWALALDENTHVVYVTDKSRNLLHIIQGIVRERDPPCAEVVLPPAVPTAPSQLPRE